MDATASGDRARAIAEGEAAVQAAFAASIAVLDGATCMCHLADARRLEMLALLEAQRADDAFDQLAKILEHLEWALTAGVSMRDRVQQLLDDAMAVYRAQGRPTGPGSQFTREFASRATALMSTPGLRAMWEILRRELLVVTGGFDDRATAVTILACLRGEPVPEAWRATGPLLAASLDTVRRRMGRNEELMGLVPICFELVTTGNASLDEVLQHLAAKDEAIGC